MRLLVVTAILLASGTGPAANAGEQKVDKSHSFMYSLPEGWKVLPASGSPHDVIVLPADDGRNRNIVINDQPGTSALRELKQKYERDLPRALKEFELIRSELIELPEKRQAIRIVHTNTAPGVPVRQINYILNVGGKRYFVACTVLKEDGDKYDQECDTFVSTMAKLDK